MTMSSAGYSEQILVDVGARRPSRIHSILHFIRSKPLGAFGAVVVALMLVVAIFAPVIATHDYGQQVLRDRLQGPSTAHWMGTDNLGRDIFSRVVYGARVSIRVGVGAMIIATGLAALIGLTSGYYGGKVDLILQRLMDIWMALPGLVALIFLVTVIGQSLNTLTVLLGVLGAGGASRIIRGAVIVVSQSAYVESARVVGASDFRIMIRHVFPNILHVIVVGMTVSIGGFILAEASLAFLGFGVPPPFPTWGSMLNVSREFLEFPWLALFPGLALTLTVFAFNVLGDALRDTLDPRMRGS